MLEPSTARVRRPHRAPRSRRDGDGHGVMVAYFSWFLGSFEAAAPSRLIHHGWLMHGIRTRVYSVRLDRERERERQEETRLFLVLGSGSDLRTGILGCASSAGALTKALRKPPLVCSSAEAAATSHCIRKRSTSGIVRACMYIGTSTL